MRFFQKPTSLTVIDCGSLHFAGCEEQTLVSNDWLGELSSPASNISTTDLGCFDPTHVVRETAAHGNARLRFGIRCGLSPPSI